MTRREIAQHPATDVNPMWEFARVSDSSGLDEYHLDIGDGWLVLDPREPDDRAQMVEIGNALLAAARTGVKESQLSVAVCDCCKGDPEQVCDSCGYHACFAGLRLCDGYRTAGVVTAREYDARRAAIRSEAGE